MGNFSPLEFFPAECLVQHWVLSKNKLGGLAVPCALHRSILTALRWCVQVGFSQKMELRVWVWGRRLFLFHQSNAGQQGWECWGCVWAGLREFSYFSHQHSSTADTPRAWEKAPRPRCSMEVLVVWSTDSLHSFASVWPCLEKQSCGV